MAESDSMVPVVLFQPRVAGVAAAYLAWKLSDRVVVVDSGCWEWQGAANSKGYGVIHLKHWDWPERAPSVHRVVYMLCVGPVLDDLCVLHRCDNPPCVRPDHLFLGTNLDNIADKMAKGRHRSPVGENHGSHRLTAELVMEIRRRAASGETYASIARDLGFSQTQVSGVARGKQWKHLPMLDMLLGKE